MAKIIYKKKEINLNDGDKIDAAAEQLGVQFSCRMGICRMCKINITKGSENLSELSEEEMDAGMDKNTRLACQCRIEKGTVIIKY